MSDMWANMGQTVGGPFRLAGAIRSGYQDPWGEQRQLRQQSVKMNDLKIAQEEIGWIGQLGIAAAQDPQEWEQFVKVYAPAMIKESPSLQKVFPSGLGETYLKFIKQQAEQGVQSQIADTRGKEMDRFLNVGKAVAGGEMNPNAATAYVDQNRGRLGLPMAEVASEFLPGQKPDWATVETAGPGGNPETRFVNRTTLPPQGQSFQKPVNYDIYSSGQPGQSPVAMNPYNPSGQPIMTGLPPTATKMGTPKTDINVGGTTVYAQGREPQAGTVKDMESDIIDGINTFSALEANYAEFDPDYISLSGDVLSGVQSKGAYLTGGRTPADFLKSKTRWKTQAENNFLIFRKFITGVAGGIDELVRIAEAFPSGEDKDPATWMAKAETSMQNSRRIIRLLIDLRNKGIPRTDEEVKSFIRNSGGDAYIQSFSGELLNDTEKKMLSLEMELAEAMKREGQK